VYNILPFVEQATMHQLAGDGSRDAISVAQKDNALRVVQSPLDLIRCPSRRIQNVYPKPVDGAYYARNCSNATGNVVAGRSDYAINCGDRNVTEAPGGGGAGPGPGSATDYSGAIGFDWVWDSFGIPLAEAGFNEITSGNFLSGVSFRRSTIGEKNVVDGLSNTYLIGEKYLNPLNYETGTDNGDNETWCTGFNNDNFRTAFDPPLNDTPGVSSQNRFGSAHAAGCYFVWCDGHVSFESYDIDQFVHRGNANRTDGGRPFGAP
jgi:hypothetical protein